MNIVFVENDEILVTVKKSMPMERQSFISPCYGPGRKKRFHLTVLGSFAKNTFHLTVLYKSY